jgi:hypothetical protein
LAAILVSRDCVFGVELLFVRKKCSATSISFGTS